ncbi:MAG: hypothetical protein U0074_08490 [Kouleothrix sp.]
MSKRSFTIYNGHRPVKQQILWLQRAYMERLAATSVVSDFRQSEPVKLGCGEQMGGYMRLAGRA